MAHHTLKSSYSNLIERLNHFPQGAPPSDLLYKILKILFSEKEAGLVALLPIKPFTAKQASRIWNLDLKNTRVVLENLAKKALLVDIECNGTFLYALPPPMAGFFSRSRTLRPDLASLAAQLKPPNPAPMTITSNFIRRGLSLRGRPEIRNPSGSTEETRNKKKSEC